MSALLPGKPSWTFVIGRAVLIGLGGGLTSGEQGVRFGVVCLAFALCMSIDRIAEIRA